MTRPFVLLITFLVLKSEEIRALDADEHKTKSRRSCPKVFVYDIPSLWDLKYSLNELGSIEPDIVFGSKCPGIQGYRKSTQQAMAIMVLFRLMRYNTCSTTDPEKADLFLIPTYPKAKNATEIDAACLNSPKKLEKLLPYLTEETAHKHFMLLAKGHVAMNSNNCIWWKQPSGLMKKVIRITFSPVVRGSWQDDMTLVHGHAVTSAYGPIDTSTWTREKLAATIDYTSDDVIFPHSFSVPYPSSINWGIDEANAPWKDYKSARSFVASFIGSVHGGYGEDVRKNIIKDCERLGEPTCFVDPINYAKSDKTWRCEYLKTKARSTFCLEPGGDSPYRKSLSDDLLFGCIPVLFSPYMEIATPWHWDHFINDSHVHVNGADYVAGKVDLFKLLGQLIISGKANEMRKVISKRAHAFQYSIEDYPNDAVERLLAGTYQASSLLDVSNSQPKNFEDLGKHSRAKSKKSSTFLQV
jgi:hypothetical protein